MKKSIKDSYQQYKESSKENSVNKKLYLKLTAEYNKFMISKVLKGEKIALPMRMGTLQVVGKKQKVRFDEDGNVVGLAPDWVKTKALWEKDEKAKKERKRIFHLNQHTDGVRYTYFWSKNRVIVENKTLYALRMTRENKRAVWENIMERVNYITKN